MTVEKTLFSIGKSMASFNSKLLVYQRVIMGIKWGCPPPPLEMSGPTVSTILSGIDLSMVGLIPTSANGQCPFFFVQNHPFQGS